MTWQLHVQARQSGSIILGSKIPLECPCSHLSRKGTYSIPNPIHTFYLDNRFYIPRRKGALRFGIRFPLCKNFKLHSNRECGYSRSGLGISHSLSAQLVISLCTSDSLFYLYMLFWHALLVLGMNFALVGT